MLAKYLFEDSVLYEWYSNEFREHGEDFCTQACKSNVFKWRTCKQKELRALPTGFKLDLLTPTNEVIATRLKHVNGSICFDTGSDIIHIDNETHWKLRLGIKKKLA